MMEFRKLNESDLNITNLSSISRLIYQTDPFIYPAMFKSEEDAIKVLSKLIINGKDAMFVLENIYVALENDKIVALVLWKKGCMQWCPKYLREIAAETKIELSENFELVCRKYFDSYNDDNLKDIVSLINVCVDSEYRSRGIARKLLESFFEDNNEDKYELFCLEGNEKAVKLYSGFSFRIISRQKAFTVDDTNIYSVRMILEK